MYKTFPRLLSLDIFRGLTVALMIIVNSPGNEMTYSWLEHSNWDGCTLADVVFPFFIFIVGISLVFNLNNAKNKGIEQRTLLINIFKRTLFLFSIGLLLNAFPYHFELSTLRFYGVLQRIAICYGTASILYLTTSIRTQVILIGLILITYWIALTWLPWGNFDLSESGNFAAFIDRMLFSSAHLYGKTYDPEGFLSMFPAIATALSGNLVGHFLCSFKKDQSTAGLKSMSKILLTTGLLCLAAGYLWSFIFPINKALWTSSYVLWTNGLALITFAACLWLFDIRGYQKGWQAFILLGKHALLVYVLHVFFLKVQFAITIAKVDGNTENLKFFLSEHLFGWASLPIASFLYAMSYTLLWIFILVILKARSSSRVS